MTRYEKYCKLRDSLGLKDASVATRNATRKYPLEFAPRGCFFRII